MESLETSTKNKGGIELAETPSQTTILPRYSFYKCLTNIQSPFFHIKMKHIFSLISLVLIFQFAKAQQAKFQVPDYVKSERNAFENRGNAAMKTNSTSYNYDVKYYRLKVEVDPALQFVIGEVTIYFVPTAASFQDMIVDCNAVLNVTNVDYHGTSISFDPVVNVQRILHFPSTLTQGILDSVTIQYNGAPPSGSGFGSFITDTHGTNNTPVMWTLSEPYGASDWWICKNTLNDKADSLDMYITAPAQYRAASNGLLQSEINNGAGKVTAHWKHRYPITSYLVALAVTNYSVYSDYLITNGGLDSLLILNYVYPEDLPSAQAATANVGGIIAYYESKFGPYPFRNEKYGHAQFGWGGGQEHQTMSFVTNYDYSLLAHELAHQWFGDKITCHSFQDIWLNEGFATYCAAISDAAINTPNDWGIWRPNTIDYVTQQTNGSVYCTDTTSVNSIFNWRLTYQKGALLLHMLRWKMGDAAFFTGMHDYMQDPNISYNYSQISDFQTHMETASGLSLTEFFDDWYYGQGFPTYQALWNQSAGNVYIQINQTPSHPSVSFFDIPLPIQFSDANGNDTIVVVNPTFSGQVFSIPLPFSPITATFDPAYWILCKHTISLNSNIGISIEKDIAFTHSYPNPTQDKLHISSIKAPFTANLYDLQGKLLQSETITALESDISLAKYPKGVYLLECTDGEKIGREKIVKE